MIINMLNKFIFLHFSHDHRYLRSDMVELQIYNDDGGLLGIKVGEFINFFFILFDFFIYTYRFFSFRNNSRNFSWYDDDFF